LAITFNAEFWRRVLTPVSVKQTALLALGALVFGALFVNYIEYGVFAILPADAVVPSMYHLWLEVLYVIPFLGILMFRGPLSLSFIYVLGRIASLGNDFAYPLYAKYIARSYDGSIWEWWGWLSGFGSNDAFSWTVELPFMEFQMTSAMMGINLATRLAIIAGFFIAARMIRGMRDDGGDSDENRGRIMVQSIDSLNTSKGA